MSFETLSLSIEHNSALIHVNSILLCSYTIANPNKILENLFGLGKRTVLLKVYEIGTSSLPKFGLGIRGGHVRGFHTNIFSICIMI